MASRYSTTAASASPASRYAPARPNRTTGSSGMISTTSLTSAIRSRSVMTGSAVEPGRDEPPAVVVTQVRPVVLERPVPHRDVGRRRRVNVVLLPGEVPLDLVDDVAPDLGVH